MNQFYLAIAWAGKIIKTVVFLGLTASIYAMEQEEVLPGPSDLLAALDALVLPQEQIRKEPVKRSKPLASSDNEFSSDAKNFILFLPSFLEDYPELPESEIRKMFKFYAEKNPTSYEILRTDLMNLKERTTEIDQNLKKEFALKLFRLEYQFRFVKAQEYKEGKIKVIGEKNELDQEHSTLKVANTQQITKTKHANWRSYGAGIGGALATFLTGFLTWYLSQPAATPCMIINGTIV